MISFAEAYGEALCELGEKIVVLDADLSTSTGSSIYKERYPDNFYNCGIMEQSMLSIAGGLALEGKIPFVSSYANFLMRGWEQIRNLALMNLNVKIVGTHAGLSVGEDGPTHQALEDIALMRAIPNMTILSPADSLETKSLIKVAYLTRGPVYIRLPRGKIILPDLPNEDFILRLGKNDFTIASTGIITHDALKVAEELDATLFNIQTIKPTFRLKVNLTCEDHSVVGGLGESFGCENRVGVEDKFGVCGDWRTLYKVYGLDCEGIKRKVLNMTRRG